MIKVVWFVLIVQVDILHPLASLDWRECSGLPVDVIGDTQAVCLNDKVYVGGGGWTFESTRDAARLYIYTPATDTWTTLDTPVRRFGLTTYHSQLVLVGGVEYVDENYTGKQSNKVWTLSEDGQWQETLPPIPTHFPTCASAVSHGDHLLVIAAYFPNCRIYVYNGHHWASAPLPQRLYYVKSTIFNGHWYLMGTVLHESQKTCVYSASLDSFLASCQPSETSQPSSLWKRLTDVPRGWCCPVEFGNRLVAVGVLTSTGTTITGGLNNTYTMIPLSLYAYSSLTQSWVHMGDAPSIPIQVTPCAVLLPSNELMIVSGLTAFKSRLTCKT
jgi:hypothetical protein